jgi:hypothetical protein
VSLPLLYSPRNVSGVALAPGASLSELFQFRGSVFVAGLWIATRDGDPASLAALRLGIVDDDLDQVIADGIGGITAPALAIVGRSFRAFPLQRPARAGSRWLFTLTNQGLASVTPDLLLTIEAP